MSAKTAWVKRVSNPKTRAILGIMCLNFLRNSRRCPCGGRVSVKITPSQTARLDFLVRVADKECLHLLDTDSCLFSPTGFVAI